MTAWLIALPMACYLLASVSYGIQGNWPLSIVYFGYALANVGLLAVDLGMMK